jgi:hypothetical protein
MTIRRVAYESFPLKIRRNEPPLGLVGRDLEHDPEKWTPVFRKDHAPTKKLDHDPIQFDRIMV